MTLILLLLLPTSTACSLLTIVLLLSYCPCSGGTVISGDLAAVPIAILVLFLVLFSSCVTPARVHGMLRGHAADGGTFATNHAHTYAHWIICIWGYLSWLPDQFDVVAPIPWFCSFCWHSCCFCCQYATVSGLLLPLCH